MSLSGPNWYIIFIKNISKISKNKRSSKKAVELQKILTARLAVIISLQTVLVILFVRFRYRLPLVLHSAILEPDLNLQLTERKSNFTASPYILKCKLLKYLKIRHLRTQINVMQSIRYFFSSSLFFCSFNLKANYPGFVMLACLSLRPAVVVRTAGLRTRRISNMYRKSSL